MKKFSSEATHHDHLQFLSALERPCPSCTNDRMDLIPTIYPEQRHSSIFTEFGRCVGASLDFFVDFVPRVLEDRRGGNLFWCAGTLQDAPCVYYVVFCCPAGCRYDLISR